jgi:hypothetical protein
MDLVEQYERELGPKPLRVRYEDIAADREATLRRVFDFLG